MKSIVGIFADLFRMDYDVLKPEDMDINAYLEAVLKSGEFHHTAYHPVRDFLSVVADVTIILPIIESITGYDYITGEYLTDMERVMKGAGAAIDLITLGSGGVLTDLAEAGIWAAAKTVGKSMAVDAIGAGVGYLVSESLQEMGYSAGTSALLSALATGTVTYAAGKYLFKNAAGEVVGEYGGEELSRILKDELGHSPDVPKVKGSAAEELLEGGAVKSSKGAIGDVLDDAIKGVKEGKILTISEAEEYAFSGIKGSDNADIVVLGKYDSIKDVDGKPILDAYNQAIPSENSYNVIAENMDAQYFELDNWNELTKAYPEEEMWKINERFLDIQTSSGREIYLVNDPKKYVDEDSFFAKEIQYLGANGYKFIKEGEYWHAVR